MNDPLTCPHCGKPLESAADFGEEQMLKGEQAYRARACGLSWAEIALALGYTQPGGKGSAHTLAKDWAMRHGKHWPPEEKLS